MTKDELINNKFDFDIDGKPLHIVDVSRINKIMFFDNAIAKKRDISAFHLNNVFCEYADLFYKGKSHKTTMTSFKKYMEYSATKHSLILHKMPVSVADRSEFKIRTIWSFVFDLNDTK